MLELKLNREVQDALYDLLKGEDCDFIIAIHKKNDPEMLIQTGGNQFVVGAMANKAADIAADKISKLSQKERDESFRESLPEGQRDLAKDLLELLADLGGKPDGK